MPPGQGCRQLASTQTDPLPYLFADFGEDLLQMSLVFAASGGLSVGHTESGLGALLSCKVRQRCYEISKVMHGL